MTTSGGECPRDDHARHPVDAAVRGARHGAPAARRPSPAFTWGWRAALLLPAAAVIVLAVCELAAEPPRGTRAVAAGVATVTLLVLIAWAWWGTDQPRLDPLDGQRVRAALGKETCQQVGRALRRRQSLPLELQPWAVAYLRHQLAAALPGAVGACGGMAGVLLTASGPDAATTNVVFTALFVVCAGVILASTAVS